MFGLVGEENPVVIDSLWKHVVDFGRDVEIETQEVNLDIAVETNKLTDEEVDDLIDDLDTISFSKPYDGKYFAIEYDNLPENNGEKIYKIEVHGGEVPEGIYEEVIDLLNDYGVDYEEV